MTTTDSAVRVLVVDDQPVYLEAAQMVIDMSPGFEVVGCAQSGEEAVDMTIAVDPDLVLMDINLPGVDGFEATRTIRSEHPRTKVIIFSSHSDPGFAIQAVEAGAMNFISKSDLDPRTLHELWIHEPTERP